MAECDYYHLPTTVFMSAVMYCWYFTGAFHLSCYHLVSANQDL